MKEGKRGRHFTHDERLMLEYLWCGKGGLKKMRKVSELAVLFGKHRRSVERELARGMVEHLTSELEKVLEYNADYAQQDADYQKTGKGPAMKIGNDRVLCAAIAFQITEVKYSPYAVVEKYDREGWPTETRLSAKSIYRYITGGMLGGVTAKDLPCKGKRIKQGRRGCRRKRFVDPSRDISSRPAGANDRSEDGHWEIDTVKSAKDTGNACLLTLTERKKRLEIIRRLPDGTALSAVAALDGIERELGPAAFAAVFKTITGDNGTEFADWSGMETSCLTGEKRLSFYFAHPYRACERGSNENANGMIRRHFPKGTDFSAVPADRIARVQDWMNRYPRAIHHGASAFSSSPVGFTQNFAQFFLLAG
jgi:IS30 family transposase